MTETRAAQTSRNLQQALYLAEGALDEALARIKTTSLLDGETYPVTPPPALGAATYRLFTESAEIIDRNTQQLTRRIEATGSIAGHTTTVGAYVSTRGPLSGMWTQGPIYVLGTMSPNNQRGSLSGTLRSGLGIGWSVKLWRGLDLDGSIQVSQAGPTSDSYVNIPTAPDKAPYQHLYGTDLPGDPWYRTNCWDTCGVYLMGIAGAVPAVNVDGIQNATMKPIPRVTPPYSSQQCQGIIQDTSAAPSVRINDNGPMDLNPAVGAIDLCVQYVYIEGPGNSDPKLVFNAPTTIYVTSSYQPSPLADRVAVNAHDVEAVDSANQLYPDGVNIVTTSPGPAGPGTITLNSSRFSGSIYAPDSFIAITPVSGQADRAFSKIVGREVWMWVPSTHVTIDDSVVNGSRPSQTTATINAWQN